MSIPKIALQGLETLTHRRRVAESINDILSFDYDDSRRQTKAEKGAGIIPVNYAYPVGCIDRYQHNAQQNTTDMTLGLTRAIAVVNSQGGGRVTAIPGSVYKIVTPPIVLAGVDIDLQGATFNLAFPSGSDIVGLDFRDDCSIHGGKVNVVSAGNPTGGNAVHHCAVLIGAGDGSGTGYKNCRVYDLEMDHNRSDVVGGTCVFIASQSSNAVVENIRVPDNSTISAVVRIHWQSDGVSPTPTASYHPHNIRVTNIRCGAMTKAATTDVAVVDIVGAYDIDVSNISAESFYGDAVVQVRPGAIGSSVAGADVQALFCRGIKVRNVSCPETDAHLVLVNGRAHGIGSIAQADYSMPCVVEDCTTKGTGSGGVAGSSGFKAIYVYDAEFRNCEAQQHLIGLLVEDSTRRIKIDGGRFWMNETHGIAVVHSNQPLDTHIRGTETYLNGQDGTNCAGIYMESSARTVLEDNITGHFNSETDQHYGFRVADTSSTIWKGVNRVRNVKSGGVSWQISGPATGTHRFAGGTNGALSGTNIEFATPNGVQPPVAAADDASILASIPMVLTNFNVKLSAAPGGAGKARTLRIDKNGGSTALEITLTNTPTTGVDYDAVEVAAGDTLTVESQVANTPAGARAYWSVEGIATA